MRRLPAISRPAAVGIGSLLLVLGLGACSGDTDTAPADETSAATQTSDPSDSTDDASVDSAGNVVDTDEFLARLAAVEPTTYTAAMTITAPGATITADAVADPTSDPHALQMDMSIPGVGNKIGLITIGNDTYTRIPGLTPSGKWIKADAEAVGADVPAPDPNANAENFSDGVTEVVFVGEDDVDGVATEHYRLTVDSTEISDPDEVSTTEVPETFVYDVWLDEDDHTVKFATDLGDNGTVEAILSDFGEPVSIEAPAKSDLVSLPGL